MSNLPSSVLLSIIEFLDDSIVMISGVDNILHKLVGEYVDKRTKPIWPASQQVANALAKSFDRRNYKSIQKWSCMVPLEMASYFMKHDVFEFFIKVNQERFDNFPWLIRPLHLNFEKVRPEFQKYCCENVFYDSGTMMHTHGGYSAPYLTGDSHGDNSVRIYPQKHSFGPKLKHGKFERKQIRPKRVR